MNTQLVALERELEAGNQSRDGTAGHDAAQARRDERHSRAALERMAFRQAPTRSDGADDQRGARGAQDEGYTYSEDVELWRAIPGYEGRYEVSDHGRLVRVKGGIRQLMTLKGHYHGYVRVWLYDRGVKKSFAIHRLVMAVFSKAKSTNSVDHLNANKLDNRLSNLEYVEHSENISRAFANGLTGRCEKSVTAKLTNAQVIAIRRRLAEEPSHLRISREFGVSARTIYSIAKEETWTSLSTEY